jgi:ribose 1,5-bisphosphokinase
MMPGAISGRGTLFLVVGPSGAGKDTLIEAARAARPDMLVPVRVVTRSAGHGGEIVEAVSPEAFARRECAGGFALSWRAHGLAYGVPAAAAEALAAGRDVLVNVSRSVVDRARERFPPCRVLLVTAAHAVLATRLAARRRETAAQIAARLVRADYARPQGPDVTVIENDGELAVAVDAFLAALQPVRA